MKLSTLVGSAVIVLFLLGCVEGFSYVVLRFVPQISLFAYAPEARSEEDYAAYLKRRDPELGWPGTGWLAKHTDDRGARLSPANTEFGDAEACMSLYGDSFTFSDEAPDADAWGNVMAAELGCRVANYGVSGYGTGQALMRLERHAGQGRALGDVIILSLYPDDLNRNVNRWRYLLQGSSPYSFKPAFVQGADGIEVAPIFSGDYEAFRALIRDPAAHLPGEAYLPDADGLRRPVTREFPYTWALIRIAAKLASSFRALGTGGFGNFANYPAYYDTSDGPSPKKAATARQIIARYGQFCEKNGKKCVFMLIPDPELLYQRDGTGDHDLNWILPVVGPDLLALDATEVFQNVEDICAALVRPDDCNGHFNREGYRRLAHFVLEKLKTKGWSPVP